jgi:dihydroorotate dehydrogenase
VTISVPSLSNYTLKTTWDLSRSFEWNSLHGPLLANIPHELPPQQPVDFLSWRLRSPLGIAAGPLPNAHFVKVYAQLGYSLLTYKSVRSRVWNAYPKPVIAQLRPVDQAKPLSSTPLVAENSLIESSFAELSSTNSVGLPSPAPEFWREDIRHAREYLKEGQVLIVSVVGTPESNGTIEQLADDYANCARWAVEAGADIIEVNLSCPNVLDKEGDLYLDPMAASLVVRTVRNAIGQIPLSAKLGFYVDKEVMHTVFVSITPFLDALTLINSIKFPIVDINGRAYFPGSGRECAGVCGAAIRPLAQENTRNAIEFLKQINFNVPIIAVGGVTEPYHVDEYLDLGAKVVTVGTAAIWRPFLSYDYAQFSNKVRESLE